MLSSFLFQICSILYILMIMIIYFSKKRIDSVENKIYKYLIIADFCILIVDIISVSFIYNMDKFPLLNLLFGKLFLIMLLFWEIILLIYVFVITCINKEDVEKTKVKAIVLGISIFIIVFIMICILPLDFEKGSNYVFSNGPAAMFTYISTALIMVIWIIRLLSHLNYVKKQKYTPLLLYICMMIVGALIQFNFPQLLVVSFVSTFVTCLMYHTIENPDIKMIEQLNIARDQADKANNAKSDFLSSMSHEIRTPLNAIVGFSTMLKDETNISSQGKEEVEDIISASQTLLEIVNGILDISKIEANKLEIVNNEYDINKMLKELVNLTKVRIGEKPIKLKVSIDEAIPSVLYGDQIRVKQIILNLLTNAAKYTDEGYIEFNVSSVIQNDVCRLIISVKDTGRGIKKESLDKLFTKFERLEEKNSTIEGTGLGLAITKKLIDLMGGNIVVQSDYQKGSNFIISLDQRIVKNPKLKEEKELVKTRTNLSDKRILIVDDNELNLKVAVRLLQPYEIQTDTVNSGDKAIEKIKSKEKYDLILLDDMMPNKSGSETLVELRELEDFNIPVVVLTANAIEGMKEKYLEMGFDDYLAKPISKEELKRVLLKYLN